MSYIDTIDHEFLGFFAGLPLYRPLATISDAQPNSKEFNCTPANLILGGGSGEHPAIVLRQPASAVAAFVMDWTNKFPDTLPLHFPCEKGEWPVEWDDFLVENAAVRGADLFSYADWETPDHHRFYELCQSPVMHSPYAPGEQRFERWLSANLGELIFFCLPELVPDIDKHLPRARQLISHAFYVNILTPPPGLRVTLGRTSSENSIDYGHHRWWPMPPPWSDTGMS